MESDFDLDLADRAEKATGKRVISGFWRRLAAFFLDGLLLGLVGLVPGLIWFNSLVRLGGWGRLIGFFVAIVYFGVLNSAIGRGQTVGKRIMQIQVIDRSGHCISLGRSFLRYAVLGAPFFLNQLIVPPSALISPIGSLVNFIMFGFGGATIYLYVFNRRTRQGLHDLIAGTFVARTTPSGHVAGSIWRPHLILVGLFLVAVMGLSAAIPRLTRQGVFPDLLSVERSIEATGEVHKAEVFVGKKWSSQGGTLHETTYLQAKAVWKEPNPDFGPAAQQVAAIILRDFPKAMDMDIIEVKISYGYDIGFGSMWKNQTIARSPSEWSAIVAHTPHD